MLLACGLGQWEDTTGALDSTRQLAVLLAAKGIRHELDLWGHDFPHDWPSWRTQLAHHLPRCLGHLDEIMLDWVASADFDKLLVQTVRSVYPAHEHEQFIAHLRGLLGARVRDESGRLHAA